MEITVKPGRLSGTVRIIESKSHVHRLLITAALGQSATEIGCLEGSADIDATIRCVNALGADIRKTAAGYHVRPVKATAAPALLDCGESGSTLRFLLPVVGALGKTADIQLRGRLPERPLSPLWEELAAHGMQLSKPSADIIHCEGQLKPGDFTIPGNISSQFISGLLFALPILDGDSTITVTGSLESKGYIHMTLDALAAFGIKAELQDQTLLIPGNQVPAGTQLTAEGDWSNAAFWLCAGAFSKDGVTCIGLNPDSLQGDRAMVDLLKRFGATVSTVGNAVSVQAGRMRGFVIDAADIPDLVPILSVCAAMAEGVTTIVRAERLKIKESDRLLTVSTLLRALGADITETDDGLVIRGGKPLSGGVSVSSCNDHRIAMSAAIAATVCEAPVTINGADAVNKSYPKFWEHFENLGGRLIRG